MPINGQPMEPPDVSQFEEGFRLIPDDELAKYAGLYVAISPDGKEILASGKSRGELDDNLARMGIHYSQVVHDYIDDFTDQQP